MRRTTPFLCGTLAVFLALGVTGPADADQPTLIGTASVIDGDTLEIHGQRIRLFGIDAIESRQRCFLPDGTAWRCGTEAANRLAERIGRRTVSCRQRDIDRYNRVVAVCEAGGEDLNAWMVENGWAVAYRQYSRNYVAAEDRARRSKRGIWAAEFEMPWDWRRH